MPALLPNIPPPPLLLVCLVLFCFPSVLSQATPSATPQPPEDCIVLSLTVCEGTNVANFVNGEYEKMDEPCGSEGWSSWYSPEKNSYLYYQSTSSRYTAYPTCGYSGPGDAYGSAGSPSSPFPFVEVPDLWTCSGIMSSTTSPVSIECVEYGCGAGSYSNDDDTACVECPAQSPLSAAGSSSVDSCFSSATSLFLASVADRIVSYNSDSKSYVPPLLSPPLSYLITFASRSFRSLAGTRWSLRGGLAP